MTQAQPLSARDHPDLQYNEALAAKRMKGMGYLGRSQSLTGPKCSSKQPCRRLPTALLRRWSSGSWSRSWSLTSNDDSYGYRPNKSALDAVGRARQRCWRHPWVLDLD